MDISSIAVNSGIVKDASTRAAVPGKTLEPSQSKQVPQIAQSSQPAQTTVGNVDVSPAQVKQIVAEMQSNLDGMNIGMEYSFYGKNNSEIAVKVVNKENGEVIREIPPKEVQALQVKIGELVGNIFDRKV
jgi:flagellar protein FlaG